MHKVRIEKGKYAEFIPFSQSGEIVLLDFGESLVCCPWGQANIDIAKHNERVSKAEMDCALRKALERLLSQASECEDNRKKAPKANEKPKDDKSINETPNRSARPPKPTEKGKSVLDERERKYLEAVLAPFKNRVAHIEKEYSTRIVWCKPNSERISVKIGTGDFILLPWFDKGTMYKGMVANCEYTAEELGLWK